MNVSRQALKYYEEDIYAYICPKCGEVASSLQRLHNLPCGRHEPGRYPTMIPLTPDEYVEVTAVRQAVSRMEQRERNLRLELREDAQEREVRRKAFER